MANKIKVGIAGGAGYTGGELIRILLNHPQATLAFVHSNSNAGKPLHAVHGDLIGDTNMLFASEFNQDIDVLFLCVGHGDAKKFLTENSIDEKIKVIDLSQDFRLMHHANIGGRNFIYGLPELNKEQPPFTGSFFIFRFILRPASKFFYHLCTNMGFSRRYTNRKPSSDKLFSLPQLFLRRRRFHARHQLVFAGLAAGGAFLGTHALAHLVAGNVLVGFGIA